MADFTIPDNEITSSGKVFPIAQDEITANRQANFIVSGFNLFSAPKFFPPSGGGITTVGSEFNVNHKNEKVKLPSGQTVDVPVPLGSAPAAFGLPVFTNLIFEPDRFQELDGQVISYEGLRLDAVLMEVSMQKNIIKNEVQGLNGTVKTYISDGDYNISVRGAITSGKAEVYPKEDVEQLQRLFTVPQAITVTSNFLTSFGSIQTKGISGISKVVVESFSFPQSEGFRDVQLFTCNLLSDTPIELTIDS